jgi:DNA-binding transcriptional regulator YiaG
VFDPGKDKTNRAKHGVSLALAEVLFAAAYEFSVRTVQEWERGAKKPSGPARTLLRAIRGDPEGLRKALAAAWVPIST